MGRRIRVRMVDLGDYIRVAATAYALPSDRRELKSDIKREKKAAMRWLYFKTTMRDRLDDLIYMNFTGDDWATVLTCNDEWAQRSYEELIYEWKLFLKRLRYRRQKAGRPPVKYIYVVEGIHGDRRHHIHLLLGRTDDEAADIKELSECWHCGEVQMDKLGNVEWSEDPARYLTKEPNKLTPQKLDRNCYVSVRGLARPVTLEPYFVRSFDEIEIPEGYVLDHQSPPVQSVVDGGFVAIGTRMILKKELPSNL